MSNIWRDLRLWNHQVQDLNSVLRIFSYHKSSLELCFVSKVFLNNNHLSQPAYAGLHIVLHLLDNIEELDVVDVVDGVVGAKDPQVLLDPVVHQCPLELRPISLYHCEQLVLSKRY